MYGPCSRIRIVFFGKVQGFNGFMWCGDGMYLCLYLYLYFHLYLYLNFHLYLYLNLVSVSKVVCGVSMVSQT